MVFVDGQPVRAAVHLPRACVHDADRRVVPPAGFEHRQLRAAIDLQIRVRIPHAVDVADLPGQVEDHLAVLHQRIHRRFVTNVRDVDVDVFLDAVEVEPVAAVLRVQGIDDQDVGAGRDQRAREIAADEPHAARDHHPPAAVVIEVGRRHGRSPGRAAGWAPAGASAR